jgi:hypothetical protein
MLKPLALLHFFMALQYFECLGHVTSVTASVSDPDPHGSALNLSLRIRIRIPDPDPGADKISSKSQNNSYHLELFD